GFITKEDREIINIHEVENFLRSDIYRRMKAARRVWREQRFRLRLPAAFFSRREDKESIFGDEKILVQGVIDSFFVEDDGGVIIIDYKTDRLSRAELNNPALAAAKLIPRHSRQLAYYRAAVSLLLDVPQKSITPLIYSLPLGAPVYPTEEDLIAAVGVLDL
ncbi:MAG TPA: PD-(D/E)XK nuclease family protein, partial [Bacillota bacterium]|nr:PD-(D/E)XK nuclease family protein [Bacillota bacterium]